MSQPPSNRAEFSGDDDDDLLETHDADDEGDHGGGDHGTESPADALALTIPTEFGGQRLDATLANLLPTHSRERLKRWIVDGLVRVDGAPARPRTRLRGGEHVELDIDPAMEGPLIESPGMDMVMAAEDIAVPIVATDAAYHVIDKPAGMVVHPGAGNPRHTLMNALLGLDRALAEVPRAGLVHRLDKDTSGLLLVARTLVAHTALVRALAAHEVTREYLALVRGHPPDQGVIDAPVGRHPVHRTRMAVTTNGRPARTHYLVEQRFEHHTLLAVRLETGRTHQIRVHLAHIGYPIVGDPVYKLSTAPGRFAHRHKSDGPWGDRPLEDKRWEGQHAHQHPAHRDSGENRRVSQPAGTVEPRSRDASTTLDRQALHAVALRFRHPLSAEPMAYTAPIPADMRALLDSL